MTSLKFIILTWITSLVSAAHCQVGNSSSEPNCIITTFDQHENGTKTPVNKWESKLINSCPESYKNEDIIEKCANVHALDSFNRDLFTPITNYITNITYLNQFCANCSGDNELKWSWFSWSFFNFTVYDTPCDNYLSEIKASEIKDLDKWTKTFINNGMTLESQFVYPQRKLQCSMGKSWPIMLLYNVVPCLLENYIIGLGKRLKSCQYVEKNGKTCMQMDLIIEGLVFFHGSNKNKFFSHLSQINLTRDEYIVEAGYHDVFYMCKQIYYAGYWGKLFFVVVSIAFLIIYLITNFNKRYFQVFSNQLLYIYSIGLIVMYAWLNYIYLQFPVSYVSFNVAKIFWSYHFFWTTLILIVFSHIAFFKCDRCENITQGATHKFYLSVVFIFGLVLPISLPKMYLDALETNVNQCPTIIDHLAQSDVPAAKIRFLTFILELSLPYFMPMIIFVGIFCILCNIPCDPDDERSEMSKKNSPVVLVKMILIMGIHWVLYKMCLGYYGNENSYTIIGLSTNMDTIAQLSIDFHGVIIFFVVLFEKSKINNVLKKYGWKSGSTTQQGDISAPETTVQFLS